MTLFLITLGQLTLVLTLALAVSGIMRHSASRAHRVLLIGLVCVVLMPLFSWSADQMGWGLIAPSAAPTTQLVSADRQDAIPEQPSPDLEPAAVRPESINEPVSALMNHDTPGMTAGPPTATSQPQTVAETKIGPMENLQSIPATSDSEIAAASPRAPHANADHSRQSTTAWLVAIPWWTLAIVAWCAVSAWLFLRLLAGGWSAWRITRTSRMLDNLTTVCSKPVTTSVSGNQCVCTSPRASTAPSSRAGVSR